jgi:hypothetical protein
MIMLIASYSEAYLLIDAIEEFMGIQSYAVFVNKIYVIRFLRLS